MWIYPLLHRCVWKRMNWQSTTTLSNLLIPSGNASQLVVMIQQYSLLSRIIVLSLRFIIKMFKVLSVTGLLLRQLWPQNSTTLFVWLRLGKYRMINGSCSWLTHILIIVTICPPKYHLKAVIRVDYCY